jgi:hypothetical protein
VSQHILGSVACLSINFLGYDINGPQLLNFELLGELQICITFNVRVSLYGTVKMTTVDCSLSRHYITFKKKIRFLFLIISRCHPGISIKNIFNPLLGILIPTRLGYL